ncbi:MAG: transporter substrate-binding domain-containing protein [Bacteriovoracales bacterium]
MKFLILIFLTFSLHLFAFEESEMVVPEETIATPAEPQEVVIATPTETKVESKPGILVSRGSGNIPPFEWENENGIQGFHIDLVKEIGKRLGINIQFESVPWKRALIKMQVKSGDAITYVSKTVDREEFIIFLDGNIISVTNVHLFTIDKTEKKEKMTFLKIRSLKDFKEWYKGEEPAAFEPIDLDRSIYSLKDHHFAIQKGYTYGQDFEGIEGLHRIYNGTIYDLKNSVLSGEADIGLVDIDYFNSLFKDEDFFKRVRFSTNPYFVSQNYLGFSKKPENFEIAKKFSDEMIVFKKTPQYQELLKKYNIKGP